MFNLPSGGEWLVIGLVGLLIFGRRLPEVARSIGRSIVEFRRGLRSIDDVSSSGSGFDKASNTTLEGIQDQRHDAS